MRNSKVLNSGHTYFYGCDVFATDPILDSSNSLGSIDELDSLKNRLVKWEETATEIPYGYTCRSPANTSLSTASLKNVSLVTECSTILRTPCHAHFQI